MRKIHLKLALIAVIGFAVQSISSAKAQMTDILPQNDSGGLLTATVAPVSSACLNLRYDLYQGLHDETDSSVLNLQKFLVKNGYLTAVPNGYFGSATLSAVRKYQFAKGIQVTGRVGPQTRAKIQEMTCSNQEAIRTTTPQPTASVPGVTAASSITIAYPKSGESLKADTTYEISWPSRSGVIYDLLMVDENGVGAGYIASSLFEKGSYSWKVGRIFYGNDHAIRVLPPGKYRVYLRDKSGSSAADQYSGVFTLLEKPVAVSTIMPATVSNGGQESVVLYGSGFDATSLIRFDNVADGISLTSEYRSEDGRILIFSVPSYIRPGRHSIYVNNTYSSGATTTASNPVSLEVTTGSN